MLSGWIECSLVFSIALNLISTEVNFCHTDHVSNVVSYRPELFLIFFLAWYKKLSFFRTKIHVSNCFIIALICDVAQWWDLIIFPVYCQHPITGLVRCPNYFIVLLGCSLPQHVHYCDMFIVVTCSLLRHVHCCDMFIDSLFMFGNRSYFFLFQQQRWCARSIIKFSAKTF